MKIAVSGAHWTGKTTLVEKLCLALQDHVPMVEPYNLLEEEGHVFPEFPGVEDFELQLDCSIEQIVNCEDNTIFDRCPVDFLAYIVSHPDYDSFDVNTRVPKIQNAMEKLDLLVFVPIEAPDLVTCPEWENKELRSRVDEELQDIIIGDTWDFNFKALEASGTVSERSHQVLERIKIV
jgi:hypothetical protein